MAGGKFFLASKRKAKFKVTTTDNKRQTKQIVANKMAISKINKAKEWKRLKLNRTYAPAAVGTEQFPLNISQQGVTEETRNGNQIVMKKIIFRWASEATGTTVFRFILYIDNYNKNSNVTITAAQLFNSNSVVRDSCISTYTDLVGKGKRFNILYDSGYNILANGQGRKGFSTVKHIRLGHKVNYTTNTGTGTDIIDRKLILTVISNDTACTYGFSSQIFFTDP